MEHLKFKVEKTAHVFTQGKLSAATETFWFVAHGYGQLASQIIRKFEGFDATTHFIAAPEALNRFYWQFKTNKVGASWMTRDDRLDEIADYSAYLTMVFDHFRSQMSPSVRVVLFGFSQGCATIVRWLLSNGIVSENEIPSFDALVLWGGLLPEDIDYQPFTNVFQNKKLIFVCGDKDEFLDADRIKWHLDFAEQQRLKLDYVPFEGKHEILVDVLENVFSSLNF